MSDEDVHADIQPSHHWPAAPLGTTIAAEFGGGVVAGPNNLPSTSELAPAPQAPALPVGEPSEPSAPVSEPSAMTFD